MTGEQLEELGRFLFGDIWKPDLAKATGLRDHKKLAEMAKGRRAINPTLIGKILAMVDEKVAAGPRAAEIAETVRGQVRAFEDHRARATGDAERSAG